MNESTRVNELSVHDSIRFPFYSAISFALVRVRDGNTWIRVNASGAWSGRAEFSEVSNGFRLTPVPSPVPVLSLRPVGPGELYFGDSILPPVLSDALPNFGND